MFEAARPDGVDGEIVSLGDGQDAVCTYACASGDRLPAASAASTAYWYVEPHDSPVSVTVGWVGVATR